MFCKIIFKAICITLIFKSIAAAQIPVEVFSGDKKTTLDIMFFKFFKDHEGKNTEFLFFNRNRASIDYKLTETTNLPQFGFTEALSYNNNNLKGFAPVLVATILNKGIFPKAGIQFAKIKEDFTVFTWLVSETANKPDIDYFLLIRFTPKLYSEFNLFSQLEFVNSFPTESIKNYTFTQRLRFGLESGEFQFGLGIDLTQLGRVNYIKTDNIGVFVRYEF